jgi:hypothetical protein
MARDRRSDRKIIETWEKAGFEPKDRENATASLAAPGEGWKGPKREELAKKRIYFEN